MELVRDKRGRWRQFIAALLLMGLSSISTAREQSTGTRNPALPDFDIREFRNQRPVEQLQTSAIIKRREAALQSFLASPEEVRSGTRIVAGSNGLPRIYRREGHSLSEPSASKPEDIARSFLRSRADIFTLSAVEVRNLRLLVENIEDKASFLAFNQTVNGVDVFNAHIKFTLNKAGEVIQTTAGDVLPGLSISTTPKLNARQAVLAAFTAIGLTPPSTLATAEDLNGRSAFHHPLGTDYTPISAELSVFPMSANSALLAYRIFIEGGPESWYEVLVDAESGSLLFRHNLYSYLGQARVWQQSPAVGTRTLVTFPDPSNTNPAGWLPVNGTETNGNNVDAYIDRTGDGNPDNISHPDMRNGRAYNANQVFDFPFADARQSASLLVYQPTSVTNLFYFANLAHDYFYGLGFNEASGNFQTDNFNRGGLGNDAIRAEAQAGFLNNNASFGATPDGIRPRLRMGIFILNTPGALDASYEGQIAIHEYAHGVTNRLVGARTSTSCLSRLQSAALGEGWSDYFAISFYNNPINGAYVTQNPTTGIRRQNFEGYTFTFEDIGNSARGYEEHDDGEIWAATLWDLRKSLGQATTDKLVIDGIRSTPCNPSMTDARDAIISADQATNSGVNIETIWKVFARHGLGYSAVGVDGTLATGTRYDAAYDLPPTLQSTPNPVITSDPLALRTASGDAYRYSIVSSNPATGTLNYVLNSGPAGMTVNSSSGSVAWTATFNVPRVKVTISDGRGGKVVHGYALPVNTTVGNNTPLTITGSRFSNGLATFTVPPNSSVFQVRLRGGSGDADLTVQDPDGLAASSFRTGTTETLSFVNPKSGRWQIQVDGYADYSTSLTAELLTPVLLTANSSLANLNGSVSSEAFYRVNVPPGASSLVISTANGTGDVDLFVKKGSPPTCQVSLSVATNCLRDFASIHDGVSELVSVNNPPSGDWYIMLAGFTEYVGVRLDITTSIPPITLTLTGGGSAVTSTVDSGSAVTTGYAGASVGNGAAPFGTAVFSYSQNGYVVSEAGIPASPPTQSARIFIDYRTNVPSGSGTINISTGLAIVNRTASPASLTFTLRDRNGQIVTTGRGTLAAGAHQAKLLQELKDIAPDFNLPANFPTTTLFGSLEIAGTQPVSLMALRLTPNQRGDVLLTSTPIADMSRPLISSTLYFPQLVDGGGYTTSVILLNTSGAVQTGTLSVFDDNGVPLSVRLGSGTVASTFSYSIPSAGSFVFQTDGSPSVSRAGWVKLTPDSGSTSPVGSGIFSYSTGGILVTESGVPSAVPTTRARVFVDKSNSHDTGLAIANPGAAGTITVRAFQKNGTTSAGNGTATMNLSANGHTAAFVGELISGLPEGFTGVAELSSATPFVALTLRSLTNGRGDFLLTTFPIADANQSAPTPIVFPHIATGGGYTTQFIMISAGGDGSVLLSFYGDDGLPVTLPTNQ